MLFYGSMISWCSAVNQTTFADVTPQRIRSTIYSLDRVVEGCIGAASAPLVGVVAVRVFGFDESQVGAGGNGAALGTSLGWNVMVPWTVCFVAYSFLHWTYPKDRDAAFASAAAMAGNTVHPVGMRLKGLVPK